MADNAFVKIGTTLLKHQVKKLVGYETLEVIGEELADIGGDKLDAWLNERSTREELEKAAQSAQTCFREKVTDNEIQQWMISLPLGNLPKVVEAIDELPSSPDESKLDSALRESIALNWKKLSHEQVDNAVHSFLSCLRSALLPIEKQTLMVIGRSVLRTEDKVDLLLRWFEQYIITGKPIEIKQLNPEPVEGWNLKHPYAMPPNFTGRVEERKMLVDWLNKDTENRLFILRALGGFGKSALTWHWLTHDVDSKEWSKVIFWSFYEGDASFEHFIEETLKYLQLNVPQGQRPQVDELLKAMQGQNILLIMDGFERALRAYSSMNAAYQGDSELPSPLGEGLGGGVENQLDCVNLNAEIFLKSICSLPNIKSKVLMTTRLTPRAIKPRGEFMLGCREVELTSMQPADAVEFFHKQGIKGTHAEIEAACAPYGYHPLSLRLLAGRILKDFENPADIVVAQRLKIDGDLKQHQHHVLEVSYDSLPPHEGKLLSTISCFRSPVELKTLQAIAGDVVGTRYIVSLQDDLHDLVARGLLHFDEKNKKFDLHPIVRRYAYQHFGERNDIHKQLALYFLLQITEKFPVNFEGPFAQSQWLAMTNNWRLHVKDFEDVYLAIELYYHMLNSGNFGVALGFAMQLLIPEPLYRPLGAHHLIIELLNPLTMKDDKGLPVIKDLDRAGWVFNALSTAYSAIGQAQAAVTASTIGVEVAKQLRRFTNEAVGLGNLAYQQINIGELKNSATSLQREISLHQSISNEEGYGFNSAEVIRLTALERSGVILVFQGKWDEAKENFSEAYVGFTKYGELDSIGLVLAYKAWLSRLIIRSGVSIPISSIDSPVTLAQKALEQAEVTSKSRQHSHPSRLFMEAHKHLGASYRIYNQLNDSEKHLSESLKICREINAIDEEANVLLEIAEMNYDQNNYEEAKSLADEALLITERCGYVLQGADVNLFLAQYALEQEKDKAKAKQYAEEAKELATCDGPPYYYKVAYEEAERFLENLK